MAGKKNQEKRTYDVLKRLRHDGEQYAPGEQVELTDTEASGALKFGAIELADASPAPAPTADSAPNLVTMTKAEIVAHAKDEHDLDLDESAKKDELIAQVKDAQAKAATENAK